MWVWLKLYLTPKRYRYHFETDEKVWTAVIAFLEMNFSDVTLEDT